MTTNAIEEFARTVNDNDNGLPKSRGRCFDIGTWGGCGAACPAFIDGECGEPQEIPKDEVIAEHGEEANIICKMYRCYEETERQKSEESGMMNSERSKKLNY